MAELPLRDVATALSTALADRYRVERELGAGGMATVYLAEDLKHRRKVAIKVLRPELAAVIGAARFLREIETIAGLQHPHILGLIDSGEVNGTAYYVMPFVEGESLRDRLNREKQLPIADAVRLATEIAAALGYAHRHGVVHRDIKPENILLHDGAALVADFGIALAASKAGGERMTETGMSLGTPHYMSPEQAMGEQDLDGRADIYALGCVLHEMVAGEPPFTGPSAQAIVAKVMASEPTPLSTVRKMVPAHVEDAVLTALQKIPADRFATAGAFAAALGSSGDATRAGTGRTRATAAASRRRLLWPAAVAILAVAALVGWLRPRAGASSGADVPPTQLALLLPDFGGAGTALRHQLEISPDGTALLYVALVDGVTRTKWIGLDGSEGRVLEGVQPNMADYRISPDGRSFIAANSVTGALFRYPIGGATEKPLPRGLPLGQRGAIWASDGSVWLSDIATASTGLTRLSPTDSVTRPFGNRNADVGIMQILPGDRMALAVRQPMGSSSGPATLVDLRTGDTRVLVDDAVVEVRYAVGHLVYVLGDGTLHAAPFDLDALRITAPAVQLASGVVLTGTGLAQFAVASNGTIAYSGEAGRTLMLADRAGAGRTLSATLRNYHHPRFSPDGRRIAMDFNGPDGRDVWVQNLDDGTLSRATFDRDGHDATWSPDGRTLAYTSFRNGVFGVHRIRPGSTETSDSLLTSPTLAYTGIWLRDASALVTVGQSLSPESNLDIGILRNAGRGPIEPVVATRFIEQYPALSRDDKWLAYSSNQSGREEVYMRPLEGGEQVQVSVGGGTEPLWSPDGRELFYRGRVGDDARGEPMMMAASVVTTPTLAVTSRKALFPGTGIVTANPHGNFDVSPDGRTFVFIRSNPSSRVIVIQNLAAMVAKRRASQRAAP